MYTYLPVFAKILAESLLSLYPIFVKYINISFNLQMWSRFFTYTVISIFFINWKFIMDNILSKNGILLSLISIVHVYSSYRGFELLESGVSYIIFYTYPLLILLFSGIKINTKLLISILMAILGVYLLSRTDDKKEDYDNVNDVNDVSNKSVFVKKDFKENYRYEGIIMIMIAAITEALIYFLVRNLKSDNSWNYVFLSYALGTILMTVYYNKDIRNIIEQSSKKDEQFKNKSSSSYVLIISLIINSIIGLFGYLLRFYAIKKLDTKVYSMLSYFGILMAYVYGVIFNKDVITVQKIIGTMLILIPNIYVLI